MDFEAAKKPSQDSPSWILRLFSVARVVSKNIRYRQDTPMSRRLLGEEACRSLVTHDVLPDPLPGVVFPVEATDQRFQGVSCGKTLPM